MDPFFVFLFWRFPQPVLARNPDDDVAARNAPVTSRDQPCQACPCEQCTVCMYTSLCTRSTNVKYGRNCRKSVCTLCTLCTRAFVPNPSWPHSRGRRRRSPRRLRSEAPSIIRTFGILGPFPPNYRGAHAPSTNVPSPRACAFVFFYITHVRVHNRAKPKQTFLNHPPPYSVSVTKGISPLQ